MCVQIKRRAKGPDTHRRADVVQTRVRRRNQLYILSRISPVIYLVDGCPIADLRACRAAGHSCGNHTRQTGRAATSSPNWRKGDILCCDRTHGKAPLGGGTKAGVNDGIIILDFCAVLFNTGLGDGACGGIINTACISRNTVTRTKGGDIRIFPDQ